MYINIYIHFHFHPIGLYTLLTISVQRVPFQGVIGVPTAVS